MFHLKIDLKNGQRKTCKFDGPIENCRLAVVGRFGTLNLHRVWVCEDPILTDGWSVSDVWKDMTDYFREFSRNDLIF